MKGDKRENERLQKINWKQRRSERMLEVTGGDSRWRKQGTPNYSPSSLPLDLVLAPFITLALPPTNILLSFFSERLLSRAASASSCGTRAMLWLLFTAETLRRSPLMGEQMTRLRCFQIINVATGCIYVLACVHSMM